MRHFALPLLVVSSLLTAKVGFAATRPQYGGTLRVTTHIAPASLDPIDDTQTDSSARRSVIRLLFDTLDVTDSGGNLRPSLATSWQAEPGNQRWTFRLRRDVKFSDGSALSPEIAAASLRLANPSWKIFAEPESVVIECDSANPNLAADLARPRNAIVKRATNSIVGTGAFRVQSFTPMKHLTLVANEESWAGRPFIDAIEIDLGRSGHDELISIDTGRADIAEVTADQTIRAASGHSILTSKPIEFVALTFLHDPGSTDDRNLRAALALCIDRASIQHAILQSSSEPTAALLPNWMSGYAFVFSTTRNLELANQKSSEVRQPRTLTFAYDSSDPFTQLVAERITLNAKDVGITLQKTSSAAPDLRLVRIPLDSPNPELALGELASRVGLPGPKTTSPSSSALFHTEDSLLQSQRAIPLFYLPASFALGSPMRGVHLSLDGVLDLTNAWLGAPGR